MYMQNEPFKMLTENPRTSPYLFLMLLCQDLRIAQQQKEELAAALEGSQGDTVLLSQALEEAQALLEQMNAESEAQASELQVLGL